MDLVAVHIAKVAVLYYTIYNVTDFAHYLWRFLHEKRIIYRF